MSHTPGTWYAVGYWVEHDDDSVADICTCDPADMGQDHLGRTPEEIEANARLIAAAPDLLNAVRFLLSNPDNRISAADINAAEAVLARVKS
tara:strand:- start:1777 stop:2049 length:273 start_codon:yes stop_codon:yes gene_type:complete